MRLREEGKLLSSLRRRGLISDAAGLDDILSLTVEDVLSRRLQSMVFKKGMATSPLHSRQLIVHGHVMVGDRTITVPGYEVGSGSEALIRLAAGPAEAQPAAEEPAAEEQPAEAK